EQQTEPGQKYVVEHNKVVTPELGGEYGQEAQNGEVLIAERHTAIHDAWHRRAVAHVERDDPDAVAELSECSNLVATIRGDAADRLDVETDKQHVHGIGAETRTAAGATTLQAGERIPLKVIAFVAGAAILIGS